MKNNKLFAIVHFVMCLATCYGTTIAHELYEDYPSRFTSILFPINESIWEHAKLFFVPCIVMLLIVFILIGRKYRNFLPAASFSCVLMPIIMMILYPSIAKLFGIYDEYELVFSIILTCVIIIGGYIFTYAISVSERDYTRYRCAGFVAMGTMLVIFAVFTYYQPEIFLWYDPSNEGYGFVMPIN